MLSIKSPYTIVTIITPETDDPATSGRVVNLPCSPTVSHETVVQVGPNEWTLRPHARKNGYGMMLEFYAQERREADAAAWVKQIADEQAGKRCGPFPREKLPREVIRRQACGELDDVQALEDANRTAPVTGKVSRSGKASE